jgi:hypothetical protein
MNDYKEEKLLPCPLCGGEAAITENICRAKNAERKYHAACNNYGCDLYGGLKTWHRFKSDAIDAWNKRAIAGIREEGKTI